MQIDISTIVAAVISAAFAAAAAIIVAAIQSRAQHNQVLSEFDKRDALQAQRIDQLEKKMDKHNQLIERVYRLEQHDVLIDEQIKVANHRIEDLENK